MRYFQKCVWACVLGTLAMTCAARAQAVPTVQTLLTSSHPAVPSGWKEACVVSANSGAPSPNCPVLQYNGYTYWAWSDINNGVAMAIVAYDPAGVAVKQWNKPGARYIWQITVDPVAETVGFVGQSNSTITMSFTDLFVPAPGPGALTFVNVGAPAVNCIFAPDCTVTATDTTGAIPMPPDATGSGILQSRTFVGAAGSPGAGNTAYEYRVDMTQAVSSDTVPCVTDLAVDIGADTRLSYDTTGQLYDAYVVTSGGIGTVGLFNVTRTGNVVDFVFSQPVCASPTAGNGQSSYFIGIASSYAPTAVTAHVGWPGLLPLDVGARGPDHPMPLQLKSSYVTSPVHHVKKKKMHAAKAKAH